MTFENLEQFVDRLLRRILPRRRDTDRVGEVAQASLQGSGFSRRRHLSEVEVKMDLLHNIPRSRVQTIKQFSISTLQHRDIAVNDLVSGKMLSSVFFVLSLVITM